MTKLSAFLRVKGLIVDSLELQGKSFQLNKLLHLSCFTFKSSSERFNVVQEVEHRTKRQLNQKQIKHYTLLVVVQTADVIAIEIPIT